MPGYEISWYFSGMEDAEPDASYATDTLTQCFVRNSYHYYNLNLVIGGNQI